MGRSLSDSIVLDGVTFSYSCVSRLLFSLRVSLAIPEHRVSCLLGLSGSGKTSLLRIISGLLMPDTGSVFIHGQLASKDRKSFMQPAERGIAMVFQSPSLLPNKTALENVMFGIRDSSARKDDIARNFLSEMGMLLYTAKYPHELSMGQQQRVSIARAFASGATIMLLDEPFSNLDVETGYQIREYLLTMVKKYKRTIVLVTHNPKEAMLLADCVFVLDRGRIVQHGTTYDIYRSPSNLFVARFFGEINVLRTYTDGNGIVILPCVAYLRSGFKNCNVVVGIRHEALVIAEENDHEYSVVTVKMVRFLGSYNLVRLEYVSGTNMDMRCSAEDNRVFNGARLRIKFNWRLVFVFDAALNEVTDE